MDDINKLGLDHHDELKAIDFDLGEFFGRTRPTYQFAYCRLEFIDCLKLWHIVKTPIGFCLELDPIKVERITFGIEEAEKSHVSFYF